MRHRAGLAIVLTASLALAPAAAATDDAGFVKALEKGRALMRAGDFKAAVKPLEKAERLSGGPSLEALTSLASCFDHLGEFEAAERYSRMAIAASVAPADRARSLNLLGLTLLLGAGSDAQRLAGAEAAFREVLEVTDGQANAARYNLAEVLDRLERVDEARNVLSDYLERLPEDKRDTEGPGLIQRMACLERTDPSQPPLRSGGDVTRPEKVSGADPRYTKNARSQQIEGVLIVEAIIDRHGNVKGLELLQGLESELDEAALRALETWKFKPATLDGCPVEVYRGLTVGFRLEYSMPLLP
jgi:TonB family protein